VTGQGTNELIEAAWPIIAKAREAELLAIEIDREEEEEREVPADYNPALMPPLRAGKASKKRKR